MAWCLCRLALLLPLQDWLLGLEKGVRAAQRLELGVAQAELVAQPCWISAQDLRHRALPRDFVHQLSDAIKGHR
jgi:hypothetical protein